MKRRRILVVDDDPEFQDMIRDLLGQHGFEPVAALGGVEAIDTLAADPEIDLMLLDVMMPDMDGYEVCRKIKESEATSLPIVFVSAMAQPEDIRRGYDCGGDDYIVKPFEIDDLVTILNRVLAD